MLTLLFFSWRYNIFSDENVILSSVTVTLIMKELHNLLSGPESGSVDDNIHIQIVWMKSGYGPAIRNRRAPQVHLHIGSSQKVFFNMCSFVTIRLHSYTVRIYVR
jgi:hypothetical protein